MKRKRIRVSVDHHDRLGGPRVQSRETSKASTHEELGVSRRRLHGDLAADVGVIRGKALADQVLREEGNR